MKGSICRITRILVISGLLAGLLLTPTPAYAAMFMVNTTDDLDDGVCDTTHCSLREAINEANTNPGLDEIRFDSLPAGSIIILDETLPTISDNETKIRAHLHPDYAGTPVIGVDGTAAAVAGSSAAPGDLNGSGLFTIDSQNNQISGLGIYGFGIGPGILVTGLAATGNTIQDNFIGTDLTGSMAVPNASGVAVEQASGTTIQDNLISGNTLSGIALVGASVSNTTVQGNKIGTEVTGSWALGNEVGIRLVPINPLGMGPSNNTIGGLTASQGNLISGNATGIVLAKATQNVIQSNLIGTDASGSAALGNTAAGIALFEFSDDTQILNNTISSNGYAGVLIEGANNVVQGNKVGTNSDGTAALGNWAGILIDSNLGGNLIGGTGAGEGNLLSGNLPAGGVRVFGASTASNTIQGNLIGTDGTGSAALGNVVGIELGNGSIGTLVLDNVISGNTSSGIALFNSIGSVIQGNMIGTDSTGTVALGNGFDGISMSAMGAQGTIIGGPGPGQGNVISGNGTDPLVINGEGIVIVGADNLVQGNYIGTDATGSTALPNDGAGIMLITSTSSGWPTENNQIGGSDPAAGNTISGNGGFGIRFGNSGVSGTVIQNNHIGTDFSGASPVPNGSGGIVINGTDTLIGGANGGNVIAFNTGTGITVIGSIFYTWNVEHTISKNSIFQNDGLGIDIGGDWVTGNDAGDGDTGPNTFLNYPEITSFSASLVEGTACDGCLVEVFSVEDDPSGYGEGISFLGDGTAVSGSFSIDVSGAGLSICDKITTTATDANGNTSEFSPNTTPTGLACQATGALTAFILTALPGLVVAGWVFRRRRNLPGAVGGFLAGAVVGATIYVLGGLVVEKLQKPVPILFEEVQLQDREEFVPAEFPDAIPGGNAQPPDGGTPLPPTLSPSIPIAPTPTFTTVPDTTGPKVSGPGASPNPALTTSPVTISAAISDPSGVASATVHYRIGKDAYQVGGGMSFQGGNQYSLTIGPLTPAGIYEFRIVAVDNLGNPNCSTGDLDACPGGSFIVNIP